MKRLFSSHWLAAAIGVSLVLLHFRWFLHSAHKADVISGFGVSLAVLGLLVAAQPFIAKGVTETAREDVGIAHDLKGEKADEYVETEAVTHVLKERVFGATLIALGTLLNGYASALARLLGLPI